MENKEKHKFIIVGRFWKDKYNEGDFQGYIEMGLLGRLDAKMVRNKKKVNDVGAEFCLVLDSHKAPLSMLKYVSLHLKEALYEDL